MKGITSFTNKYMAEEMESIGNIVAQTGQLLPAFHMAYKKGEVDIFLKFVKENKLQDSFLEASHDDMTKISDAEERSSYMRIVEKEGLAYLRNIYGDEFGKRLEESFKLGKADFFDISKLVELNKGSNISTQVNIMCEILDLYNDDTLETGIHRSGGNIGENINDEGLNLTGDISSGAGTEYKDVYSRLEKNISFSDKHVGMLMRLIVNGGNYKNLMGSRFVDISIIAIPKKDLKDNNADIIIGENKKRLNPKYIKGYVTVDTTDNTMAEFVKNPKYIQKQNSKMSPQSILGNVIEKSKKTISLSKIKEVIKRTRGNKKQEKNKESGEDYGSR